MKIVLAFIALSLLGCGSRCDFRVKNFCVITNDYVINPDMLEWSLAVTEYFFNRSYPSKEIELEKFAKRAISLRKKTCEKYSLEYDDCENDEPTIEYVDVIKNRLNIRGISYGTTIKIQGGSCWLQYHTVTHELLHMIARYQLLSSETENASHMVPNFYVQWAEASDLPYEETIERQVADVISFTCGGLPPRYEDGE